MHTTQFTQHFTIRVVFRSQFKVLVRKYMNYHPALQWLSLVPGTRKGPGQSHRYLRKPSTYMMWQCPVSTIAGVPHPCHLPSLPCVGTGREEVQGVFMSRNKRPYLLMYDWHQHMAVSVGWRWQKGGPEPSLKVWINCCWDLHSEPSMAGPGY